MGCLGKTNRKLLGVGYSDKRPGCVRIGCGEGDECSARKGLEEANHVQRPRSRFDTAHGSVLLPQVHDREIANRSILLLPGCGE
jgi:hypothetical protein